VLQQAELALVDFEPCKASLRTAEQEMAQGAALWHQGKNKQGLVAWAAGLNDVARSVDACGVAPEIAFIQHEAQVLGLGNLSVLNEISQVIVHGADFYEDIYAAVIAIENKDYRAAGEHLGKVMNQLSEWTTGHLCDSPVCYIVNGVLQYLAALKNDIGACKSDFGSAFGNFTEAYNLLVDKSVNYGGIYGGNLAFTRDEGKIKQATLHGDEGAATGDEDASAEEEAAALVSVLSRHHNLQHNFPASKWGLPHILHWRPNLRSIGSYRNTLASAEALASAAASAAASAEEEAAALAASRHRSSQHNLRACTRGLLHILHWRPNLRNSGSYRSTLASAAALESVLAPKLL